MRESGIGVVGQVSWGTHFCVFYHDKSELSGILVDYARAGLEANEACIWVTSGVITAPEAAQALSKAVPDLQRRIESGQLEILDAKEWYTPKGKFDYEEVLAGWREKASTAKARGFAGLRATGDTSWLSDELWDDFVEYESAIGPETQGKEILVLCSYALELWEAYQMIDVVSTHEFALIMRDGEWRQIENSERRKSIEKALEMEERYGRVVNNIPVAVYSSIPGERFAPVFFSDKIEEITGYAAKEFLDDPALFERIILPEDLKGVRSKLEAHRSSNAPLKVQYRITTKSGEIRWLKNEATSVVDGQGRPVRVDGFVENVTDYEELERELEAFAYSVSHDLRAPLRRIDGFSEILLRESGDKLDLEGRKHLERIRGGVRSMDRLIEDILRLSRLNTSELVMRKLDIGKVASEVMSQIRASGSERKVEVTIQQGLTVFADPNLLRIAMENLLGNAWKFTGKRDTATIEFGARVVAGQRTFFVSDNGVGFDMAHVSRIFNPFQRLHSESEFPGTGIGLAMVKRIVSRHGGRVWAEGAEGKGATIYFTLGPESG